MVHDVDGDDVNKTKFMDFARITPKEICFLTMMNSNGANNYPWGQKQHHFYHNGRYTNIPSSEHIRESHSN